MALKFSGTAQYLLKANTAVPAATPVSFACWFKPTNITTNQCLVSLSHGDTGNNQFTMYVDTTGKLNANAVSAGVFSIATSSAPLTNGAWNHCVAIFTSPTSRVVYLNGSASTIDTTSITPGTLNTSSLGMNFAGGTTPTNLNSGTIAYPSIWNIALSAGDVATLFANGDPFLIEQANEISFSRLESVTPVDLFDTVAWAAVGVPTFSADPFTTPPSAPSVFSAGLTNVGATNVTLNGTIPSENGSLVTTVGFNYGLTSGYGSSVIQGVSLASGPFAVPLSGLISGTTYHYQAFATNSVGTTASADQTFIAGAPTFVQSNSGFGVTSGIYGSLPFTGAQTLGNANIVCFTINNTVPLSVTDTSGNNYVPIADMIGGSNFHSYIYAAFGIMSAGAGSNIVTVTAGTIVVNIFLNILEYANCGKLDTFAVQDGTSTTPTSPNISPSAINELLLGFFFDSNFLGSQTAGSGFTMRSISDPSADGVEDTLSTSTSPVNSTFNATNSVTWACFVAAFTGPAALAPACAPVGGHYDLPTVVRMSCSTPGSSIYYTIDGSTPTTSSTLYTGPTVLPPVGSVVLQMIASAPGVLNSSVSHFNFYIQSGGLWNTIDDQFDINTGARVHQFSGTIMHDPVSGYWYKYGTSELNAGGLYIYKSEDLLNWTFVALQPYSGFRNYCFYNALNNNYVLWGSGATVNNGKGSWVSSSPEGPFVAANGYDTWHSISIVSGDFGGYFDPNTGIAYMITICNSNSDLMVVQLSSDFQSLTNTYALTISTTGEAPTMWSNGPGSYFLMQSVQNNWAPGLNLYQHSSSPLGPWSAYAGGTNAFQPATIPQTAGEVIAGVTATAANAYDTQTSQMLIIPGRNAVFYCSDRYDFSGLPFYNYRRIILPVSQGSSSFTISWTPTWSLNDDFPTISGAPMAATALHVSGGVASWTNNEPMAAKIYLDYSDDLSFRVNVSSEVLSTGSTSFNSPPIRNYYRIRTVNASGSSVSNVFTTIINSGTYIPGGLSSAQLSAIQRKWNESHTSPNLPTPVN